MPGVCADQIGDDSGEEAIEVEEEEQGQDHTHYHVDEEDPIEAALQAQLCTR